MQATLIEDDEMVQTLPSDRANEALAIGILPRGMRSGEPLLNPHRMGGCRELLAINLVAIAQQVAWRTIPGEGLDQLPGRPFCRGMRGYAKSEGVGGDHETEQEKRRADGKSPWEPQRSLSKPVPWHDFPGRSSRFARVACGGERERKIPLSVYSSQWALNAEEEKRAFETFVDTVIARWAKYPAMHVYHFTGYESGALKRLMGRYATREDEIDRMLRAYLLVDLHTVTRRAVRASVEHYSLKALEPFYGFERKTPLEDARAALRQIQHALELGEATQLDATLQNTLGQYNADDCNSTRTLRDWLENERRQLEQAGPSIPRPLHADGAPPAVLDERQQRTAVLGAALRNGLPADPAERNPELAARWLLSHLLDWHRREVKSEYWEYYRLGSLSDEELLDERSGLAGLSFVERLGIERKIHTDRYSFEKQETDLRAGEDLCAKEEKIGKIVEIDLASRLVDIKKTKKTTEVHPTAVYAKNIGPTTDVLSNCSLPYRCVG